MPLHHAARNGHLEVVRLLLNHGADVVAKTMVRVSLRRPGRDALRADAAHSLMQLC